MEDQLPGVTSEMLEPDYWLTGYVGGSDSLCSRAQCQAAMYRNTQSVVNLRVLAEQLQVSGGRFGQTADASSPERDPRDLFTEDGSLLDDEFWDWVLVNSRGTSSLKPAFAVRAAEVRAWPTSTRAFRTPDDREFDQFLLTTLHTFEPLLILGVSRDEGWVRVQSATYEGWVCAEDVAKTSWAKFDQYVGPSDIAVVTGPGVFTQAQPYDEAVSSRPVEFGAVIPLSSDAHDQLGQQTRHGNLAVCWPIRSPDGQLAVRTAYVRKQAHVHEGFLPFDRRPVLTTAFRMMYERYGWGGAFGNHDCSSFVMDVYRTVGVQLPRDTGPQETSLPFRILLPDEATADARIEALARLLPGDLLFMKGHVMMFLGFSDGRAYAIHDFAGYSVHSPEGLRSIPVNQVMVAPLDLLTGSGKSYLESLTGAGSLFGVVGV